MVFLPSLSLEKQERIVGWDLGGMGLQTWGLQNSAVEISLNLWRKSGLPQASIQRLEGSESKIPEAVFNLFLSL